MKEFRKAWRELMNAYTACSEKFRSGVLDVMFPASMFAPWLGPPPCEAPA